MKLQEKRKLELLEVAIRDWGKRFLDFHSINAEKIYEYRVGKVIGISDKVVAKWQELLAGYEKAQNDLIEWHNKKNSKRKYSRKTA